MLLTAGQQSTSFGTPVIDVQWRNSTLPASSARLDELRGTAAAAGSTLVIQGDFGVARGSRIVSLESRLYGRRTLEILNWRATQVTVRVPAATPAGTYHVVIHNDASLSTASNRLPFTVLSS
jgi:hypothetical protein